MSVKHTAALKEIRAFHPIGERIGTAGQPNVEQLSSLRDAGFQAVINLALPTSDNAIAEEGSLVTKLGMAYVQIPVNFREPKCGDFRAFCKVMEAFEDRPVFVHCAANMRVSAFMFLYRVLREGVSASEAEKDLRVIWEPDEVWGRFIKEELKRGH